MTDRTKVPTEEFGFWKPENCQSALSAWSERRPPRTESERHKIADELASYLLKPTDPAQRNEVGASTAEYAIIIALVGVAITYAAILLLGGR